jgi:thioester reductase-like protein
LLGVEQIGIHDSFCELGGHSLLAVQLVAQINETFQLEVSLESFLEIPTIAGLVQTISTLHQSHPAIHKTKGLTAEANLDPSIYPENILEEPIPEIFLTGATGFLGAFLLFELLQQTRADIYCLIRASSLAEGQARIQNSLKRYLLWQDSFSSRIKLVLGDLGQHYLGIEPEKFARLAEKIDIIYHCGAWVNVVYPYSALKAANVTGTQEVLRLASQTRIKPVHFISSVDVFSSAEEGGIRTVKEQDVIGPGTSLCSGYAQSKYIAEQLVMTAYSRGLPISIYRPSNIIGSVHTGISPISAFVSFMIKGCIQMGIAPELEAVLNLVPVDYVSRAIVHLSRFSKAYGQNFNITNPEPVEWGQLIQWLYRMGYPLQQIPYESWYSQLLKLAAIRSENVLVPLTSLFANRNFIQKSLGAFQFDCDSTLEALKSTAIACPPVSEDLLNSYVSYFVQSGYLSPPFSDYELRDLALQETHL